MKDNTSKEININYWIKYPIRLLHPYICPFKEDNYDFLPRYNSFDETLYYDLINSMDKNQLRTFYLNLYINWKKYSEINMSENNMNDENPKIKKISEIDICELNNILREFVKDDKIMGIVIINLLQKQILG